MILGNEYIRTSDIIYARMTKTGYAIILTEQDKRYEISCNEEEYEKAICWLERQMQTRRLKD